MNEFNPRNDQLHKTNGYLVTINSVYSWLGQIILALIILKLPVEVSSVHCSFVRLTEIEKFNDISLNFFQRSIFMVKLYCASSDLQVE
jgi:ABC-type phosphate/phosphonate transport system permease subunit